MHIMSLFGSGPGRASQMNLSTVFSGFFALAVFLMLVGCNPDSDRSNDAVRTESAEPSDTTVKADSMDSKKQVREYSDKVRRNESYYMIFNRLGVNPQRIYRLTSTYDSLLDQFEMKPGQPYRYTLYEGDSTENLTRLVWEPDPLNYLVFQLSDTLTVTHHKKEVKKRITRAAGTIESSLYETFQDRDLPLALAFELSDLYAWEIDFFLLRSGDAFKVIYEQLFVEGEQVGIGNILAAEFRHRGEVHRAYRFYNGSEVGYYDSSGKSLKKALLKAPLKFRYISSGFSHSRYHPILHRRMPHYGIDYVAPRGTPVVSVGDGTVLTARYKGANGNMVKIRHNSTYTTTYIHLSGFGKGIRRGANVEQGKVIGFVGSTGRSTGSHLDYRLYKYGDPVDPRKVELPPTDGIAKEYMKAFNYSRKRLDAALDQISWQPGKKSSTSVTHHPNNDEGDAGKNS